jgi:hypothetical protein
VVWGKSLPAPAEEAFPSTHPLVVPSRVLVALAGVGALTWTLESVLGLGPSLLVVLVAAFGSAGAVRYGHGVRRVAVITLLVVALTGLGWIELINKVQYGTLALTGAPPIVRWCGTTYRPGGVIAASPSAGAGPAYSKILRSPSGYDVFGVALRQRRSCGAGAPLLVKVGTTRYAAYDPETPVPAVTGG